MMDTADERDQWDQHNRDEALARAAQQASAGPSQQPVPAGQFSSLTTQPGAQDATLDATNLVGDYERAVAREREAWAQARVHVDPADSERQSAWNGWRDAVEQVQQAARRLVNHVNATSAADRAQDAAEG